MHSMQAGYMEKAQKYADKAFMQIEKLRSVYCIEFYVTLYISQLVPLLVELWKLFTYLLIICCMLIKSSSPRFPVMLAYFRIKPLSLMF